MDVPWGLAGHLHFGTQEGAGTATHRWHRATALDSELTFASLFPLGDISQARKGRAVDSHRQPSPGLSGPDRGVPAILARAHCGPRLCSDLPCLG